MAILRNLVVALLLLLSGAIHADAQTAADYDALLSGSADGGDAAAAAEGQGLYDTLQPEDYERVGKDLSMLSATQFSIDRFRSGLIENLSMVSELVPGLTASLAGKSPTGNASYFLGIVVWVLFFWAVSYIVEWQIYGLRIVGPWFVSLQIDNPRGIGEKLPILAARAFLGLIGILISVVIVGLLSAAVLDMSDSATQKTVIVVMVTVAASRASAIIWRMVISPYLPNYRLPRLSDSCAIKLFTWLWITVALSLSLLAFCYWIEDLGVWVKGHKLLTLLATAVMVVVNIAMVIANRTAISQSFLGASDTERNEASWLARASATFWAPLAILYFLVSWAVLTYRLVMGLDLGPPLIVGAYTVLLGMIVAYGVVAFTIARLFQRRREIVASRAAGREADASEDEATRLHVVSANRLEGDPLGDTGEDEGGPSSDAYLDRDEEIAPRLHGLRDFEGLARRVATIFAIGAGFYALAFIWDVAYLLDEGRPLDRVEDIIDILLIGYICYEAVRIWIDGKIQEEIGDMPELEPGDEGGGHSAATRLATLLPLFRNFMLFTIGATIVLLVLLEMGVKVAPIFAGAGVVGLAIGFGAQTLIRDILSGAFFLFDDAFRKGEYIDVGDVKGTVEKISMRSFQLRHHLGALNTIPFGEIKHLTNFSRDWVMMKLPLRLTYDTDVEKVRKLIKKLGQELLNHPEEGAKFLQPLKSQGVYKMEDSAMILRVKFMTRPGDQWTTRKLVYSRIRELFEANGVKFAHREVTVRLGDRDPQHLTDEDRKAVAAAAQNAVEAAEAAAGPPRAVGDDR